MTWIGPVLLALVSSLFSFPLVAPTAVEPAAVEPAVVEPAVAEPTTRTAEQVLAQMTLEQKVGQLFMVGTPAARADKATMRLVEERHIGSIMLTGRSKLSPGATARVVAKFERLATAQNTAGVGMLVSVDQEGGAVQVLQSSGFSKMPSATRQGRLSPEELRRKSRAWGRQLHRAGVNMNLAPVLDTVPKSNVRRNEPIGRHQRHFATKSKRVSSHGRAAMHGYAEVGVVPVVKHFPGLGRVRGNTDLRVKVKDTVTTATDPYLRPFADAIAAGAPVVMMSLATYTRLDRTQPAALSPAIVSGLLRGSLGFQGVVISDSFSAKAVSRIEPADRALRFIHAGGDLILTNGARDVKPMQRALVRTARSDAELAAKIDAAALRVLKLKESQGLLG